MKSLSRKLIFAFVLLITLSMQTVNAEPIYDDEYKFLKITNEWLQISGYDNNSYSYASQSILKVIDFTDDNITFFDISSYGADIVVYNYSLHEALFWLGPIGWDFINPDDIAYYYDLWLNHENITEAYYSILGFDFTTDERSADDFIFEANLGIYLEDQDVDFVYDNSEEEIKDITDDFQLSLEIYVEYDTNGVLLRWKEKISIDGAITQYEQVMIKQRVDEFSYLEPVTDETNFASLLYALVALLVLIRASNKMKKVIVKF